MKPQRSGRRLVAIVSLDVVGYSRLMLLDEDGTPGEAIPHLEKAARLGPRDPNLFFVLLDLSWARYLSGDYAGALETVRRPAAERADKWQVHAVLAVALAQLGDPTEAKKSLKRLLKAGTPAHLPESGEKRRTPCNVLCGHKIFSF